MRRAWQYQVKDPSRGSTAMSEVLAAPAPSALGRGCSDHNSLSPQLLVAIHTYLP